MSEMACVLQTQHPVKASFDLKRINSLYCHIPKSVFNQWLDIKGHNIYKKGC